MVKLNARKMLKYTTDQLREILTGTFVLVFDDGVELETNYRETIYSSYVWDMHRKYPNIPLLSEHHVQTAYENGVLVSSTHNKLLSRVYWLIVDTYGLKTEEQLDTLNKMVYEITNNIYNDVTILSMDHMTGIDIMDFINVQYHPDIKDAMEKVDTTRESIEYAIDTVLTVIKKDPSLKDNNLVKGARAGMVNNNQLAQCIGPRGFVTEVDSKILPVPVTRGFNLGMNDMYNMAAESRSAAKALYFATTPLQDSEYFSRELQLATLVVENVIKGYDCGSTEYLVWPSVRDDVVDPNTGKVIRKSDLHYMEGKYYKDPETGELKIIKESDKHLIGKTLELRSVLFCKHPDKHSVCEACFGGLSDSIPESTNLGHVLAAAMTEQTTQSVLSTKHLDASSKTEKVILDSVASKFFRVKDDVFVHITSNVSKNTKIVIEPSYLHGIMDVKTTSNVSHINPSRVSFIRELTISDDLGLGSRVEFPVEMESSNRVPIFTLEYLEYLRDHGWEVDDQGRMVFGFEGWDKKKPVFRYPETEYNYTAHSKEIQKIIKGGESDAAVEGSDDSPIQVIGTLFERINSKLDVNLAVIEVIVYAISTPKDPLRVGDLPRGYDIEEVGVGKMKSTRSYRSLSALYAAERQKNDIINPRSFFKLARPDHPIDVLVHPQEVLSRYKDK